MILETGKRGEMIFICSGRVSENSNWEWVSAGTWLSAWAACCCSLRSGNSSACSSLSSSALGVREPTAAASAPSVSGRVLKAPVLAAAVTLMGSCSFCSAFGCLHPRWWFLQQIQQHSSPGLSVTLFFLVFFYSKELCHLPTFPILWIL